MDSSLPVFLTVDIGPADAILGRGHETQSDWTRTTAGLAVLGDALRSIEAETGANILVTWFLRADRLIEKMLGDRLAIFKMYCDFIVQMINNGHEIGWMPQVYSVANNKIDYEDLFYTYEAIKGLELLPQSVRMGDCFHDNKTMKVLDELEVLLDSSALPGRSKEDLGWRMNWIGTPHEAYHPSIDDYRKPGEHCLKILELPFSVVPVKAPYDSEPILRYVNPCMHNNFFGQNIKRLILSETYLLLVMHPDEVIPTPNGKGHPLIAYSVDELKFNLHELLKICEQYKRKITFYRLKDFVNI